MTKLEILQETYDYYTKNPDKRGITKRSDGTASCVYLDPNSGNRCAVGRCLKPESNTDCPFDVRGYNDQNNLELNLQDQYTGHDVVFWRRLQTFHDFDSFWNSEGITVEGQKKYDSLIKENTEI